MTARGTYNGKRPSFGARMYLTVLLSLGSMLCYMMRFNTTIALSGADGVVAEYRWSLTEKGGVLGDFFWGYIVLQMPGGYVANRFGGKPVLLMVMLGSAFFSAMAPLAASHSPAGMAVTRVGCGLCQGPLYPAWAAMISYLLPPEDHNLAAAAFSTGSGVGIVVMWLIGPPIQDRFGWDWCFFVPAIAALLWSAVWVCTVKDRPKVKRIDGAGEQKPLIQTLDEIPVGKDAEPKPFPFRQIFSSVAMWSVFLSNWAGNWVFYMLLSFLPQYMHQVFGLDQQNSSAISVTPYIVRGAIMLVCGYICDKIMAGKLMRTITLRKFMNSLSLIVPASCLVVIAAVSVPESVAVALLAFGVGVSGTANMSINLAVIDMFPEVSGFVYGLNNAFGNTAGVVAPQIAGYLLQRGNCPSGGASVQHLPESCQAAWSTTFYVTAGLAVAGSLVYVVFGGRHAAYRSMGPSLAAGGPQR